MRQSLIRLLFALLVLCSPAAAQEKIATNIADNGELKVVYADFPAAEAESGGSIHAAIVTLQVVNQYQCVPNPGNPPVGSIRLYCDSSTGNLTCINSSGGNCGGGGGSGFVFGSGTPPDIPVWVNSTTLGNSAWQDNLTTTTYNGTGGVATKAVTYTGVPPFAESAIEGPSSNCLPIADGQDALCSIADLSPAGLWYSADGAPYVPLAPQGSSNGPIFNDQLISGGGVTWTGLLNFTVGAASYAIVSTNYTSPQTNVTLAPADATNPRIDSIVVDNTGTVVVLTGTPAGSPAAPVPNPVTQLQLTTVTVAANATTPTLNSILVYDENTGTPTEWNCTPTANFNCNSTNNPFHSTHDIEATTAVATNNVVLAYSSTVNLATYSTLSFNIRNKATWPAAKSLSICFLNSATIVGQCIGFKNGIFGFNQANVSSYQQIVIPLSAFALTGIVDRVRFQVAGGGASIGFYLDWIQIQSSLTGGGGGGNFQLQVDGTATALTANLVDNASVTWAQNTVNGLTTIQATAVGAPPSGAAGGDLSGTFPNPTVAKVNGGSVPASAHVAGTNSSSQIVAATQADVSAIGYVAGGGSADAQTATLAPAVAALANGLRVCWLPSNANATTTPTLAVNGLTAKTIVKTPGNAALAANDLTTTAIACAVYDGTNFELQNAQTSAAGSVAFSAITSGTNTTATMTCGTGCALSSVPQFNIGAVGTPGILGLVGTTSGTATFTAPAVAGTVTNATLMSNTLQGPVGAVGTPTFQVGQTNTGMYQRASNNIDFSANGTATAEMQANIFEMGSNGVNGFTSSGLGNSIDTAICRASSHVLNISTSSVCNASGTVAATNFNVGAAGTLGTLVLGNATSGLITLQPTTGAITSYTIALPIAQPTSGNTLLSCTAASPAVCTWVAGSSSGTITIASGTAALGTSLIASGACASVVTVSATGTATTDNVMADFNADPTSTTGYSASASGMLTIIKYPTANNVNFKVCNNTQAGVTPGAATLNWRVVR